MNARVILALLFLFPAACVGTTSSKHEKKVGGCEIDTISLGIKMERGEAPSRKAARIEILSLEFIGDKLYKQIAEELTSLLDSLKITIYSRSELLHIKKGPCWPPYRITLRIDATRSKHTETLCSELLKTPLADCSPSTERAKGYGLFFVTCGRGDKDWWTLWYTGK